MLPNRIIIHMYMISRYYWPVRIDWAILIPFFKKKYQKIQNFNYITCKGINLPFTTPTPLSSCGLVIRNWPWRSGICDFDTPSPSKAFLKSSMPPTVVGCLPAKDAFAPEGLVTMWSDWAELRDWSFLTLASNFPIKQNGGNVYP